jgi:hypothetical protein
MFFFQNYDTNQYIDVYVYRNVQQTRQEKEDIVEMSFLEGQISMLEFFIPNLHTLPSSKTRLDLDDFLNLKRKELEKIVKRNTN